MHRDSYEKDLISLVDINGYNVKKLSKNENVSIEILGKISNALGCKIDDIAEYTEE